MDGTAPNDALAGLVDDPVGFLDAADAVVRRIAVAGCSPRLGNVSVLARLCEMLRRDPDAGVRTEVAEVLGGAGSTVLADVLAATEDTDPRVVEAAVTALGGIADPTVVPHLVAAATSHDDRLVREAAVAALGAIADPIALPVLLDLLETGPPQVRRRTVAALTVFDDPAVEPALRRASHDRNPMVREAAEMVVGRAGPEIGGSEMDKQPPTP